MNDKVKSGLNVFIIEFMYVKVEDLFTHETSSIMENIIMNINNNKEFTSYNAANLISLN